MPTYDYRCKACSHKWEEWQSITAPATKKCPECRKAKAERVIGAGAGLLFRGSGFYITDYRSDSYKKAAKADSGSGGAKSESKSDGKKSEAKPAPKD
ncbi:MAG: zinc ribbon domain-containing protein [Planctomycetaceae bacterium]